MSWKKKKMPQITRLIKYCGSVFLTEGAWKGTTNTEIISYVLPQSWQKRWPKLEALRRHWSFQLYEDTGFIQLFTSILSHWPTPDQIPTQWKTYRIPGGARQDALEHLRWHSMTVSIETCIFSLTLTLRTEKNPHPVRQQWQTPYGRWILLCMYITFLRHAYNQIQTSLYHHLVTATVHLP